MKEIWIQSSSIEGITKKTNDFRKNYHVKFSQTHVTQIRDSLVYTEVLFYE